MVFNSEEIFVSLSDVEGSAIDIYEFTGTFFPNDSLGFDVGDVRLWEYGFWAPGIQYRYYLPAIESHFEFEFFAGSLLLSGSGTFPVADGFNRK